MDSQTNSTANSDVQSAELDICVKTAKPIVGVVGIVDINSEPGTVVPTSEVAVTESQTNPQPEPESTASAAIPVGKIVLSLLAANAAWTLLCSITPTIIVYQAAMLANTNPILVVMATGSSFLTLFVTNFFFNLFFLFCFSFVFGGGAFVLAIAYFSIFREKQ